MMLPARAALLNLEEFLKKQPQAEFVTNHYFAPGVYARELYIPKGHALTGKIHRTEHLNIVSVGRIAVVTEEGKRFVIEAPYTFVSKPGTKRAGFALEDTVWTTIHPTTETNLDKLEDELIAPSFGALEADLKPLLEDK
jgi:hypothetical protein